MNDDLRPPGTVQVRCSVPGCGWCFWLDCLDPRLPDGPFLCEDHDPNTPPRVVVRREMDAEGPAGVGFHVAKEGGWPIVVCPRCGCNAFMGDGVIQPHCRKDEKAELGWADCEPEATS